MLYFILKYLIYIPVRIFWVGKINGLDYLPKKGSFILASNHSSYLDFIILYTIIPRRITWLAAEKFFSSKFWKPFMKITGQIKVDRLSQDKKIVYSLVDNLIVEKGILGIFPEGTRSRSGFLQKAYSGVSKFAHYYNIPVIPVGIIGTYEAMPPDVKIPKLKKCKINFGRPLFVHSSDYELETKKIMEQIAILSDQEYKF